MMAEKDLKNLECDEAELEKVTGGKLAQPKLGRSAAPKTGDSSAQSVTECSCFNNGGGVLGEHQTRVDLA